MHTCIRMYVRKNLNQPTNKQRNERTNKQTNKETKKPRNLRAYSTYKCDHTILVFMIDILHQSDKSVGGTICIDAWQPWVVDSYWLKSLPATTAGINLSLKWVFRPECRPHLVSVRQSPTATRQIHSCFYHMPKGGPFHMRGFDWELQLRRRRCLISFLPADVREVGECRWMNMGGLLMTNLICFKDLIVVKPQLRIGQLGGISNEVLNFKVFTKILPKAHWDHKRVTYFCKAMSQMSFPKVPSDRRLWFLQCAFPSAPSQVRNVAEIEICFCFMFMESWAKFFILAAFHNDAGQKAVMRTVPVQSMRWKVKVHC